MTTQQVVLGILDEVLGLEGRSATFDASTELRGAIPELDSMGLVSLVTSLEEHYGFYVEDDDLDGDDFATVGSLVAFVERQRGS